MNQARSRAIDRLRYETRQKRSGNGHANGSANGSANGHDAAVEAAADPQPDPRDVLEMRQQGEALRAALTLLTDVERQAIETTFFNELTHAEAAERLGQPLGTLKTRIRSGLAKLRRALSPDSDPPDGGSA